MIQSKEDVHKNLRAEKGSKGILIFVRKVS